ncbi:MAG: efflux RND transporter periplasmic adaptor subunit, partial [Prolixibacteraceae bacterium]|nr:efflux RND transporter periplasmic adaptor subunit [Prolixibacteraceae bacterium]
MNARNIFSNTYIKTGLPVIAGLLLGWLLFHHSEPEQKKQGTEVHKHDESKKTIWTCAMHPQIRKEEPGDCPICGMELIPLEGSDAQIDEQAIGMSESAMKLAEVQTSMVTRGSASKEVRLYGKIQVDERLLQSQTAHVPGRIEQLMVNVTGEQVRKGQLLARIYSPELVTAQKELLESLSLKDKYPNLLEAAREKLRNWKLSDKQISEIEQSGKVTSTFDIFANTSGVVVSRKVSEGDYVTRGAVLLDVADLSGVWGVFDAYESDLPWVSLHQQVDFTTQSIPGKTFSGKVTFIDPVIDPAKRIARVRVELNNPGMQLKPEMFINGIIHSNLKGGSNDLVIPQSAVLWTGTRSAVYVKIPDSEHPSFKLREITLGAAMKDTYIVPEGMEEGEEIVTNGDISV